MKRAVIYVLILSLLGGSLMVAWHHTHGRHRAQLEEHREDATESRAARGPSHLARARAQPSLSHATASG